MSKSVGNVLAPKDLTDAFGVDQTRYILMREIPHGQDGNFSYEHAVQRVNSDLANNLGNLAQRTLSMIYKNCDGAYPTPGNFTDEDQRLLKMVQEDAIESIRSEYEKMRINRALEDIMKVAYEANAYIDHQAPWTLKKEDPERMKTVLYVLAECIRCLALLMHPITPVAAEKMLDQLGISKDERLFIHLANAYAIKPGTQIDKPEGIFPRIEAEQDAQQAAG